MVQKFEYLFPVPLAVQFTISIIHSLRLFTFAKIIYSLRLFTFAKIIHAHYYRQIIYVCKSHSTWYCFVTTYCF